MVFFDWQNVYMHARRSFHSDLDPFVKGQVNPVDLAEELTSRGPTGVERELVGIRIYRGIPDQAYNEKGYAAARRQRAAWERDSRVVVTGRTLRYPPGYVHGQTLTDEVREKGIDVALALDFVTMAGDGVFDVGIMMSSDQDLLPALERVDQRRRTRGSGPTVEVAAWTGHGGRAFRLSFGGNRPFCHWLDQQTYWGVVDERDYTLPSPLDHRPPSPRRPPDTASVTQG
jgi:hypothetical protein